MKIRVYYGHCLDIYGTKQEARDVALLEALGFEVDNPNNPADAEGYQREGMAWFQKKAEKCQAMSFRALPNGKVPAGIAKEVEYFRAAGKPVFEIPSEFHFPSRVLSIEETRTWLTESGIR